MKKPRVLFLCTGNSARSQMAEGLLRSLAGDRFEALSAGLSPAGLNPLAVEAMAEIGIDISGQQSKNVAVLLKEYLAYVITLCDDAAGRCPIFPFTYKFMHGGFEDPAAATGSHEGRLAVFRRVRDEIRGKLQEFIVSGRAETSQLQAEGPR
jgi:arsenate reductase